MTGPVPPTDPPEENVSERERQRREMIHGYAPPVTDDDLPGSLETRAAHRRLEVQLRGRVEFWQAQARKQFDRAERAEAALAGSVTRPVPFYFCRHCWRAERRAGATLRVAWRVARGKSS